MAINFYLIPPYPWLIIHAAFREIFDEYVLDIKLIIDSVFMSILQAIYILPVCQFLHSIHTSQNVEVGNKHGGISVGK